jgi:hypothetical protein
MDHLLYIGIRVAEVLKDGLDVHLSLVSRRSGCMSSQV